MQDEALSNARNFRKVDDRLCTCGQPNERQLADAAARGVEVVINLALHDDPRYSLKDERGTVESLGMDYIHIPVQFASPTDRDLAAFFEAMDRTNGRRVLLHCGANYRVTAFLGLYRVMRLGWTIDEAFELMRTVWEPNEDWARFIAAVLRQHGQRGPGGGHGTGPGGG
jgi:protein tyrosine phosphatase (PTP) superfamily phosphohydrolase (DUF442 family)